MWCNHAEPFLVQMIIINQTKNMTSQSIKIKAIIFCRVSSKEQEETGYSLDAQEKLLTEYAENEKNNFKAEKVYRISESASGKQVRKTFNEVLQYATKNKIDVLLCEKIDRLTRNLKDAATVDDWVKENPNRAVHFVKENFILNQQTRAHDNLVWDMKVAIARFYANNLSEEVRKGQKEKLAQGWLPTKPPLGYKTTGDKGHKIHIIDEKNEKGEIVGTAVHIKQMFEWYASGNYSVARLQHELYKAGLRTRSGIRLGMSRIHELLTDPFYCGKIRWKNVIYPGEHEPLITKDLFDKVQTILRRQIKNPHFVKHNSLFKSKIFCKYCGGMLTWYMKKGHWYGHCNNHGVYRQCAKKTCVRQDRIEEQLITYFEKIAPKNEGVLVLMEDVIKQENSQNVSQRETETRRLTGLLEQLRKQKDKYFEAKINREVPLDYCEKKIGECITEEENLENALILNSDKSDEFQQLRLVIHELALRAKEIYEKANNDEKRLLLSQIFTNLTQNEYKIETKFSLAAEYLANWTPKLNKSYEPTKSTSFKGKTPAFADVHPVWLRR